MTKTLILLRHAQAEKGGHRDFDRRLTEQGSQEAEAAASAIQRLRLKPDRILASAAERTRQTAAIVAKVLKVPAQRIIHERRLYLASAEEIRQTIADGDDDVAYLLVIGHNPGMEDLAADLSQGAIEGLQTSAGAVFTAAIAAWGAWPTTADLVSRIERPER